MFRLEVTPAGIRGLIRRKILERGRFDLRLERVGDVWQVTRSGWAPLNRLKSRSPGALLLALSILLDEDPKPPEPSRTLLDRD